MSVLLVAGQTMSDMLVTVKSREVQRGMLAEMRNDPSDARRHFLAAAHLELVLATDYDGAGESELALRSALSAASCFWRAGEIQTARNLFAELGRQYPKQAASIENTRQELDGAAASA